MSDETQESKKRERLDSPLPSCLLNEPLWQHFHVDQELEIPGLLNTKQELNVDRCAICERRAQRNRAGTYGTVEPATVRLTWWLIKRCSLDIDSAGRRCYAV